MSAMSLVVFSCVQSPARSQCIEMRFSCLLIGSLLMNVGEMSLTLSMVVLFWREFGITLCFGLPVNLF